MPVGDQVAEELSKQASSRQMQDLRCIVRRAEDVNNQAKGVQSQGPEVEAEPRSISSEHRKYQNSRQEAGSGHKQESATEV